MDHAGETNNAATPTPAIAADTGRSNGRGVRFSKALELERLYGHG
jgi:hypothetical protein